MKDPPAAVPVPLIPRPVDRANPLATLERDGIGSLEDEIALVRPEALVALGSVAARSVMGRAVPVMAERGQWLARPDGRRVLITLHPSALLRVLPEEREEAFAAFVKDLAKARKLFKAQAA